MNQYFIVHGYEMCERHEKRKRRRKVDVIQEITDLTTARDRHFISVQQDITAAGLNCTINEGPDRTRNNELVDSVSEEEPDHHEFDYHYDRPYEDELVSDLNNYLSEPYIPEVDSELGTDAVEHIEQEQSLKDDAPNEEGDWVSEYLDRIRDVQEELIHTEPELNECGEGELWYDAFEELENSIPSNSGNNESPETDLESEDLDHKPLYENCPITVGLSALLIINFAMRHMLSGKALHDLLALISLHCGSPNYCFKTLFKFKSISNI